MNTKKTESAFKCLRSRSQAISKENLLHYGYFTTSRLLHWSHHCDATGDSIATPLVAHRVSIDYDAAISLVVSSSTSETGSCQGHRQAKSRARHCEQQLKTCKTRGTNSRPMSQSSYAPWKLVANSRYQRWVRLNPVHKIVHNVALALRCSGSWRKKSEW